MFPGSDRLTVFDLSGNSSKYSRLCPVFHAVSGMIDILSVMQEQIDSGKNAQRWLIINNLDDIINNIYVPSEKKQFLQLLSDVLHRGSSAGLHVMITAQKYTLPVISGIQCRVYAGKCDKKTAQKFLGAEATVLSSWDMPDSEQALARIDSDIYKINVPDVSAAAAIDATIAAATAPQAAAEHVKPEIISKQITDPTAAPEIAAPPETAAPIPEPDAADTDKNILVCFLSALIGLFSGACGFLQLAKQDSSPFLRCGFVFVQFLFYLNTMFLYALCFVFRAVGAPVTVCAAYMIACAAVQIIR